MVQRSKGYPESEAAETWKVDDVAFSIVQHPRLGHYCGYVRFPKRPVKELDFDGLLRYVPVHGGLTYAAEGEDGSMVYGFDCGHVEDEGRAHLRDLAWLRDECHRMVTAISIAAGYEDDYLAANGNAERAVVIDAYHERLKAEDIAFDLRDNFGAMIAVIGGEL